MASEIRQSGVVWYDGVGQNVPFLVAEFRLVFDWIDTVHVQEFEHAGIQCELHAGPYLFREDSLLNICKSLGLLGREFYGCEDLKSFFSGHVSDVAFFFCSPERQFCVGGAWYD